MAGPYHDPTPQQQNFYSPPPSVYPQQPPWGQPMGHVPMYEGVAAQQGAPYNVHQQAPGSTGFPPGQPQGLGADPFAFATNTLAGQVLQQSSASYLQKGQAYVQSTIGLLSGGVVHYHFNVDSAYIRAKLLMLIAPFLKRWSWTRVLEQIAGGHKYMPPRQDVNAPDLYLPFMAMFTYCVLSCVAKVATGTFTPTTMSDMAQAAVSAWVVHFVALKVLLYVLGISNAQPLAETVAYAGYPFVSVCIATVARLATPFVGAWPYRIITVYVGFMLAIFMVRTMKRVIFHEARQYRIESSRHNYVLLLLGLFEFPYVYWLSAVKL